MALAFGTSGIRGLAVDFTQEECHLLTQAFAKHLKASNITSSPILLAGDFRDSTPRILQQLIASFNSQGIKARFCGIVPTPALAYSCLEEKLPGIMVTGSHIPADRNGIKFYFPTGEILKKDERAIFSYYEASKKESKECRLTLAPLPNAEARTTDNFVQRYLDLLKPGALQGITVLFYEHSTAAKTVLPQILKGLGARVSAFGASQTFVPVDTEAVENVDALRDQILREKADLLVSADGDGDRPMVVSETGEVIPGDLVGLIAARALKAKTIVTPVSCNTAIEKCGLFQTVHRTRIGSPFVVEKMIESGGESATARVVGFEANGGFLFAPLLTRDSILPILLVLSEIKKSGKSFSQLLSELPPRFTSSGLVRNFPLEKSRAILNDLQKLQTGQSLSGQLEKIGKISEINSVDGMRLTLTSGAIIHFRPSGNAPEFRVYAEDSSKPAAAKLCQAGLEWVRSQK